MPSPSHIYGAAEVYLDRAMINSSAVGLMGGGVGGGGGLATDGTGGSGGNGGGPSILQDLQDHSVNIHHHNTTTIHFNIILSPLLSPTNAPLISANDTASISLNGMNGFPLLFSQLLPAFSIASASARNNNHRRQVYTDSESPLIFFFQDRADTSSDPTLENEVHV